MVHAIESLVRRGHPLPKLWLMTDERQSNALWPALEALPEGSGVIVRHYRSTTKERQKLAARIRRIAKRRGLLLILAGSEKQAFAAQADGFHQRSARIGHHRLIRTIAVHNPRELSLAHRINADLVFISPVFATQSHPGAPPLGRVRFGLLVRQSRVPVIALGGMTAKRATSLKSLGMYGWAAIGALTPKQS